MIKDAVKTFHWLVSILRMQNVPFVVTGGLAAKSYGSERPLNDIDIEIPTADFPKILNDLEPYIIFGPARYQNEKWDVYQVVLSHHDQIVDIGSADDAKIYDDKNKQWISSPTDFSDTLERNVFGLTVPVIAPEPLIAYKSLLLEGIVIDLYNGGKHQLADIAAVKTFITAQN